ncbi:protein mono-ADP-ribosyltransferase PARP9 isoform X3 [Rhinoderma darwinii]|uniref:protein mono-ADP-ribosyltransferase PARP9 isoform X3 n=1 Tax=Rhinoderma darwinii TaxID=43563 RepID=UPI003F6692F3
MGGAKKEQKVTHPTHPDLRTPDPNTRSDRRQEMEIIRKVPVPEDEYRVLVRCKEEVNDLFIRRFQCTAEVTGPRLAAGPAPVRVYEKQLPKGPLISVWRDDLTRQDADVVVNAANERLDHIGGLAYALAEAGGQQIVQESKDHISKKGILKAGDIAVTSAGMLPSKTIVHAVGPMWHESSAEKCKSQLREAIEKVLDYVTNQTDLHSVAIPAVSSGIFGFPLDLCANIIVNTILVFYTPENKGRLKEIRLVNNDDKTVQAMRSACEQILGHSVTRTTETSSSYPAPSSPYPAPSSPYPAPSSPYPAPSSPYPAPSSTYPAPSSSYPAQTKQWLPESSLQVNQPITINGLNLQLKTGMIEDEKTLREATKECLVTAHKYNARSISFPALGTGNIGLHRDLAADVMMQAVFDFARANQCRMDVYFVIHPSDKDTFKAFQDKFRLSGSISDKIEKFTERPRGPEQSVEEMCVMIAGLGSEDVEAAESWLRDVLSPAPLLIHNNHLLLFGGKEFDALASCSLSVDIEEDLRDGKATLKISGPRPDRVTAALQAERLLLDVQDKLAESLQEELLEAAVIWFYENTSESHRYPAKANREVEEAYVSRTNVTLKAEPGHVINIMNLTAQDREQTFTIRRRFLRDSLQNAQRSLMPEKCPSLTKPVEQSSQEFKDRSNEFRKAGFILLKMEKVQNSLLSGVFQSKKEAVEQRQQKPSTEQLYQLVPEQSLKKICQVGFHRLYATPRETKYGAGVYFKKSLQNIAQRFIAPDKDRLLYILQAEVVTGAATNYVRKQPVLPCVGSDALRVYDSLTDGGKPAEYYVIFDRFRANPKYVFTCVCK